MSKSESTSEFDKVSDVTRLTCDYPNCTEPPEYRISAEKAGKSADYVTCQSCAREHNIYPEECLDVLGGSDE